MQQEEGEWVTDVVSPECPKEHIVNGGVRFVPGIVLSIVLSHEVNQTGRQDFNPLPTEFNVQFVLFPKDPFVALDVQRGDGWMVAHLGRIEGNKL